MSPRAVRWCCRRFSASRAPEAMRRQTRHSMVDCLTQLLLNAPPQAPPDDEVTKAIRVAPRGLAGAVRRTPPPSISRPTSPHSEPDGRSGSRAARPSALRWCLVMIRLMAAAAQTPASASVRPSA